MHRRTLTIAATTALAIAAIGGTTTGFVTGRATAPTPDACIQALDDADQIIGLTSDALNLAGDGIISAATWDTAGLDRMTEDIEAITEQMDGIDYADSKAACQDGA